MPAVGGASTQRLASITVSEMPGIAALNTTLIHKPTYEATIDTPSQWIIGDITTVCSRTNCTVTYVNSPNTSGARNHTSAFALQVVPSCVSVVAFAMHNTKVTANDIMQTRHCFEWIDTKPITPSRSMAASICAHSYRMAITITVMHWRTSSLSRYQKRIVTVLAIAVSSWSHTE
eukprot:TRINITY_DN64779_c0_g2_i1.p3 TRINITY_DN64779_c0_g2~~TRINITY_DN64779_c0_g2_i1.p3  ORF type:complete len:175 (-),score=60.48 TRINITY_DN64779_c0_g2_i1:339-863(-)